MAASRAAFFALLLLAACARSEDAAVISEDNEQARAVERVRTPEQDDDTVALGEWRTSVQDDSNVLEFGPAGAPPIFSLRCDGRRGLYLQRGGAAPTGDLPMMLLTMGSETRRLPLVAVPGAVPMLRAAIMPQDPLLGMIARNRDPMVIRIGDAPPLALPPGPAVAAYVNGCANAADADTDGNDAAAPAPAANLANATAPAPAAGAGQ
jgi:hypothetical protein